MFHWAELLLTPLCTFVGNLLFTIVKEKTLGKNMAQCVLVFEALGLSCSTSQIFVTQARNLGPEKVGAAE